MIKIYPYKQGSRSARALATALGGRVLKRVGSQWRGRTGDVVINWGSSDSLAQYGQTRIINTPDELALATNKLQFFRTINDDFTVPWTTDQSVVAGWLREGSKVVARTVLTGHSGAGIIILEGADIEIPPAPLYTRYIKSTSEFRVHVVNGSAIDVQRKIRDPDRTPTNWSVRSHDNGFIYVRNGFTVNAGVTDVATTVIDDLELDFGAVDVLWNERQGRAYVLEVNCAPGLEGTTVSKYADAFRELIN